MATQTAHNQPDQTMTLQDSIEYQLAQIDRLLANNGMENINQMQAQAAWMSERTEALVEEADELVVIAEAVEAELFGY